VKSLEKTKKSKDCKMLNIRNLKSCLPIGRQKPPEKALQSRAKRKKPPVFRLWRIKSPQSSEKS